MTAMAAGVTSPVPGGAPLTLSQQGKRRLSALQLKQMMIKQQLADFERGGATAAGTSPTGMLDPALVAMSSNPAQPVSPTVPTPSAPGQP